MKKIFFIAVLFETAFVQHSFGQDSTKTQSSPLLTSYLNLKDALVGSNAATASANADAFVKALNNTDKETVKEESRSALLSDAVAISQTKDLKVQREKFATLSANMFVLAKTAKLSAEPLYDFMSAFIGELDFDHFVQFGEECCMKRFVFANQFVAFGKAGENIAFVLTNPIENSKTALK